MVLLSRKMPRLLSFFLLLCFIFNPFSPYPAHAQTTILPGLPLPNRLLAVSSPYSSPALKGIRFNPTDPLKLEFIIDTADQGKVDKNEAAKLVKYFLAGLTLPEDDLWVNLSPYEANRIIPQALSQTDLGKDLLGEDYILKQLASSLTYPETELGKKYWQSINGVGANDHSPVNNFNKVWIMPDKATIYENPSTALRTGKITAFITESSMKVMTEEDYTAIQKNSVGANDHSPAMQSFKTHILPAITQEVNQGQNFATLRQIYNALMLAVWFKEKFKQSFYKSYIDQKKISGIDINDKTAKEKIYNLYVEAFKNGVYNYVKKEYANPSTPFDGVYAEHSRSAQGRSLRVPAFKKITKWAYFSGGILPTVHPNTTSKLPLGQLSTGTVVALTTRLSGSSDDFDVSVGSLEELVQIAQRDHDYDLQRAYADFPYDPYDPDHILVKPVEWHIVQRAAVFLQTLGPAGRVLAEDIINLSQDQSRVSPDGKEIIKSRLNSSVKFKRAHAGGMGINIVMEPVRPLKPFAIVPFQSNIGQLIHEAVAGRVFAPWSDDPQERERRSHKIHALCAAVEKAFSTKDPRVVTYRLNHPGDEGLFLGDKPLWQMTQAERESVVRDYASPNKVYGPERMAGDYTPEPISKDIEEEAERDAQREADLEKGDRDPNPNDDDPSPDDSSVDGMGKFKQFDVTEIEKSYDVPDKVTITAQVARSAQAKEETIKLAGEERRPAALRKYRRTYIPKIDDALDEALSKVGRFIVIEDKVGLGGKAFQYGEQKENIIILHKSMAGDDIAQFHELAHLARVLGRLSAEDLLTAIGTLDWGKAIIENYYTQKLEGVAKEMGYAGLEEVPEDVKFHYAAYAFQAYKWSNENVGVTAKARDLGGIDFKKKSFKIKTNGPASALSIYDNGVSVTGSLRILNITMQAISSLQLRRMLLGQ